MIYEATDDGGDGTLNTESGMESGVQDGLDLMEQIAISLK